MRLGAVAVLVSGFMLCLWCMLRVSGKKTPKPWEVDEKEREENGV